MSIANAAASSLCRQECTVMRPVRIALLLAGFAMASSACGASTPGPASPELSAPNAATPAVATPGAADPAAPATSAVTPAEPAATESTLTWNASLSKDQKIAFMKKVVAPRLGKVFQSSNPTRYADFGCKTCHGPAYKDPPDFLPKLTLRAGKITAFAEKPEVSKFMHEQVVPEMATVFGQQPYDPATHQGFGCGGCHKVETK